MLIETSNPLLEQAEKPDFSTEITKKFGILINNISNLVSHIITWHDSKILEQLNIFIDKINQTGGRKIDYVTWYRKSPNETWLYEVNLWEWQIYVFSIENWKVEIKSFLDMCLSENELTKFNENF